MDYQIIKDATFEMAEKYVLETNVPVFLTGKAGTGKTTFLRHIVGRTYKRCVVLAPTGVAAVNAGGVTIHSFLQLPLCPYLPDVKELVTEYQMPERSKNLNREKLKIIRTLDLLIIDEISMVRADLLDAVDAALRRYRRDARPFGGIQILMIGDLQQLPPVVTDDVRPYLDKVYNSPFFFSSKVMSQLNFVTIELQTIYRQNDKIFLELLNKIRNNQFNKESLFLLNSRLRPGFEPDNIPGEWIRLTTHNYQSEKINNSKLEALKEKEYIFSATIEGSYPESSVPTDVNLKLKVGAQVMFVKNDTSGIGRYFNGKIATVIGIGYDEGIAVEDTEGRKINVERVTWENMRYEIDSDNNEIKQVVEGKFTQYPLRTAWAITIHKSQGLTFDRVVIDASRAFTFGQVYVALSRCRSLEGIVLTSQISQSVIFGNNDVSVFSSKFQSFQDLQRNYDTHRYRYYFDMLYECFGMNRIAGDFEWMNRLFQRHLSMLYPAQSAQFSALDTEMRGLKDVSLKFHRQLESFERQASSDIQNARLQARIFAASDFFVAKLTDLASISGSLLGVEIDNKKVRKEFYEASETLMSHLGQSLQCLKKVKNEGFSVESYLKAKSDSILSTEGLVPARKSGRERKVAPNYSDNRNPELVELLISWRTEKRIELDVPAFAILYQKTLFQIADICPTTREELLSIPGFGKTKWNKIGHELIAQISEYLKRRG